MKQAVLSLLALASVATLVDTYVASSAPGCASSYVRFLERVSRKGSTLSGDQLAALHRGSLRIFGACDSGHLADVQTRLTELESRVVASTDTQ